MDKKTLDQYHNYEVKPDRSLAADLLAWYDQVKRNLPWRGDPDPYHIWVSEAMLQQTRVETAIPYYRRFLERFPTLDDLARASEEEVLRAWQGLGYYGRARNLWHCAREVEERHGGIFPATLAELRLLSGIGDYTAAALGSIAFRLVEPALDGNALRVASRWFDLDEEVCPLLPTATSAP
jgi:A/G-specific adenine glycosylase